MNLNLEVSSLAVLITIIIRVITGIIFLTFIIPLQIKETEVKNGLKKLRFELLWVGIILFLVNTAGLSIIVIKLFVSPGTIQRLTDLITVLNTLGFLTVAVIQYNIYHYRYTPEQKKLHEKFDRMELEAEKLARKKRQNHA